MSNIFEALRRKQESAAAPAARPTGFPLKPARKGRTRLREIRVQAARELEALQERLEFELPPGSRRVVAFSAAVVGEGVSTMTLQLARVMARSIDGNVLLVDADIARTSRTLSMSIGSAETAPGFVEVVAGRVELAKAVLPTDEPNLHFLPSGQGAPHLLEGITAERLRNCLDEMARAYRFVLLDCSPILDHPESPALGALAEGVILVVHTNRTRREIVQRALSSLEAARCRVLGVVLNHRKYPIPGFLYRRL